MTRIFVLAALLAASPALAQSRIVHLHATLTGGDEVPPTGSTGTGTVYATLDEPSHTLDYTVTFAGLTGPANAAHFHGPAKAGQSAGVVIAICGHTPTSPCKGEAKLSAEQAAVLLRGDYYVNVHTAKFPKGEVRGQVMAQ